MRTESSYGWLVSADPDQRATLAVDAAQLFETRGPARGLPDGPRRFADFETELLVGRYVSNPQPLFSRLPFDYRIVPSPVRVLGLAVLDRLHGGAADTGYPGWPNERRLDDLRAELWADAAAQRGLRLTTPTYRDGHRGAVLLTHDIDSRSDIGGISDIRALERRHGLPSSVGFIPLMSWPEAAVIEDLTHDGCEVYCHDIRHDGRLAYEGSLAMRADFERFFRDHPDVRSLLRGFRSGQLLMTSGLLGSLADWFEYDLSLPDTEKGGPYGARAGCATVYPFLVDGVLEIPLTMPQDFFLFNVEHLDSAGMLSVWRDKLEAVLSRGGVAVVNTHPVWTNPKRAGAWAAYHGLLETIASADAWVTTPSVLHDWLLSRRDGLVAPISAHEP
jgi:hypothetical protein